MFTGIIEETGVVEAIEPKSGSFQLTIRIRKTGEDIKIGDSLAVNGCCLTVVKIDPKGNDKIVQFDLLEETWGVTNLQYCISGSLVNLERSLEAGGRLGGHFVTGHIDGVGKIAQWEQKGEDRKIKIFAPNKVMRYVVHKGSIAIDGISLTVAEVEKEHFSVWIIPHTFELTAIKERSLGDAVNLESDIVGKYVERFAVR
ncbi:MAG TPA: riboflavin synthase [Verrucomicrobiales bacterium]|mgnify:FL=1|nr:riboflavin synthase [Verrucomicrobiales bacterium]HBU58674.1 riboflavin synthase [Verrucomicrobiales bacterium]